MPKDIRPSTKYALPTTSTPYSAPASTSQRNAAIWSAVDDEVLLQARASGLNWQPIASRHFPNKTANACRKRHERLIERRHVEDWDARKLDLLAQEYLAVRKEMWEILASRVGERWAVVEAKCMEKGIKTLQATARTAHRRASAASQSGEAMDERGISDHHSDSGIGLEGSEAEMDVDENMGPGPSAAHAKSSSWHASFAATHQQQQLQPEQHTRSHSLPQPLPLYRPPPPPIARDRQSVEGADLTTSPQTSNFSIPSNRPGMMLSSISRRNSPDSNGRGGISIQSVLSPAEPLRAGA